MQSMVKGANIPLTAGTVRAVMTWASGPKVPDIDLRASLLTTSGTVRSIEDVVFYGRPSADGGNVRHDGKEYDGDGTTRDTFTVALDRIDPLVDRVVFSATADDGPFRRVPALRLSLDEGSVPLARFDMTGAQEETALVLGELYRRAGGWKFRAVGQGYVNGISGLAADHGFRPDVSNAAALAAAANRRRTRIIELERAARTACEHAIRELPEPHRGRVRPGAVRWGPRAGAACDLATDRLLAQGGTVPAAACFTLLDQIGTTVAGLEARVRFGADALDRARPPEDRVQEVTFGPGTGATAAPGRQAGVPVASKPTIDMTRPARAPQARPTPAEHPRGPRWLPSWAWPAPQPAPPPTPPADGAPAAAHGDLLDPVRAALARVVLPEPARREVEALCNDLVRYDAVAADLHTLSQRDLYTLSETAARYLPDCITGYADALRLLPPGQILSSGRTVDDELLYALRVLHDLVDNTMKEAERLAANNLLSMAAFLEDKRRE